MRERKHRDQRVAAVLQAEKLAAIGVGLHQIVSSLEKTSQLPTIDWTSETARFGAVETKSLGIARTWVGSLGDEKIREAVSQLNSIEAWAMHFAPGVDLVDEQMVFSGCVTAYRILVRWYYPLLIVLRAEPVDSGQFPNTVAL